MASQTFSHARFRRSARRTQRVRRPPDLQGTPHQRAIRRLARELKARDGLIGMFHAGVAWRAFTRLVNSNTALRVVTEKMMPIGGNRYVPDLVVYCQRTGRLLLVVEVWHTHAVSGRKKAAFHAANIPWVEIRSWHVLWRSREQALPVIDWGGPGLPDAPDQLTLFERVPTMHPPRGTRCRLDQTEAPVQVLSLRASP